MCEVSDYRSVEHAEVWGAQVDYGSQRVVFIIKRCRMVVQDGFTVWHFSGTRDGFTGLAVLCASGGPVSVS